MTALIFTALLGQLRLTVPQIPTTLNIICDPNNATQCVAVDSQGRLTFIAASLPLPAGAATETGHLAAIDSTLSTISAVGASYAAQTNGTQVTGLVGVPRVQVVNQPKPPKTSLAGALLTDSSGVTQPVFDLLVLQQLASIQNTLTNGSELSQVVGFQTVSLQATLPLQPCNPIRRTNCQR